MMQRAKRFGGEVQACAQCDRQPVHVQHLGKNTHSLECPPCALRTPQYATVQEALEAWETQQLSAIPPSRHAA